MSKGSKKTGLALRNILFGAAAFVAAFLAISLCFVAMKLKTPIKETLNNSSKPESVYSAVSNLKGITATPVDVTVPEGKDPAASSFVKDIQGNNITVTFAEKKNLWDLNPGTYNISVILTDADNDTLTVESKLTVTALPHTPPVITGVKDKEFLTIDSPIYKTGVTAKDYRGRELTVTIDGMVNNKTAGEYKVTYKATDKHGQTSIKEATVKIIKVTQEMANAKADEILKTIITAGITPDQKIKKIWDWVKAHVKYISAGPHTGDAEVAYRGLRGESGDCIMFCHTARVLLSRAGIENEVISRSIPSSKGTNHLWLLVDCGTGWYFFDATPCSVSVPSVNLYKFTASQAQFFTESFDAKKNLTHANSYNYFVFNPSSLLHSVMP